MKIVRFQIDDRPVRYGWVLDERVGVLDGSPFGTFSRREADILLEDVALHPPILPGKIICIGRNYAAHAAEHGSDVPEMPLIFLKPPSSVIGSEQSIVLPPQSGQVEHEAELAVVIGRSGRWINLLDAMDYVLGYTIANDVTARDLQRRDGQWTRSKGFDTFCPVGPWIETEYDPTDRLIQCRVNGELRQMASTRDMVFPIRQLIAFISSVMTLEPGDLLLTGTPAGVSPILPEDVVEVSIDGLGVLRNPVKAEDRPH
jgi:2-keto-4-pentenoate hydratase/2-oxohepta-3-ene-1,7-dioic acid hydratase in catechol pathway